MLKVAVSLPHGGKSPDVDPGSTFDADGDGKLSFAEREEYLGALYAIAAVSRLRVLGHEVRVYGAGDYSSRAAEMRSWNPDIVLYPHLDVRSSTAPLVFYDAASPSDRGPTLANLVGRHISDAFPEYGAYRAVAATPSSSPGGCNISLIHRRDRAIFLLTEPFPTRLVAGWVKQGRGDRVAALGVAVADGINDYHTRSKSQAPAQRAMEPT